MHDQQIANMGPDESEEVESEMEEVSDEDVPYLKKDLLDSTEEEDAEANYRSAKRNAFGEDEPSPADKVIFEESLKQESRRVMKRHRIDFAKMYFGKDGGYTLREFKRIYKIEMLENPDRYTLIDRQAEKESLALTEEVEEAKKRAIASGAQLFDIDAERQEEIRLLKE